MKQRILIIGGSGYIGNNIYKELNPYFDTYATYYSSNKYKNNKHFFYCDLNSATSLSFRKIFKKVKPSIIISAAKGDYNAIINSHDYIIDYINNYECKIIFISSSSVFDGYKNYPNYEFDKTFSKSNFGYLKIKIENKLLKLDENKYTIIRVPFLVGMNSLHIKKIKNEVKLDIPIEVFPNLIINIINIKKITLFIHHIINKKINGIIHLGSKDLIHHVDLIKEILKALKIDSYRLKYVYTTNDNRYIALFNKNKKLPKYLDFKANSIINTIK
ncbi:MAG: sugar nucleotide-binding protein [Flavobacteriaceae bacterium]|nr:sugar nucleotide-binding protein [Flavobacteriaceae bacterium]